MAENKPPKILYKYLTFEGGRAMLKTCMLKFTPPNKLNDPFEFLGRLPDDFKLASFNKIGKKAIKNGMDFPIASALGYSKAQWKKTGRKKFKETFKQNFSENTFQEFKRVEKWIDIKDSVSKKCGVFCASSIPNNLLMWAHYADMHKGLVVGIETNTTFDWLEVEYDNIRPVINPLIKDDQELKRLTLRKSSEWKYENEWRLGIPLNKLEFKDDKYFLAIGNEIIKEIILGLRIEKPAQDEICDIVQQKYPHAAVKQCKLSPREFAVLIE